MASVRIGGEMAWFRHLTRGPLRLYFLRNRRCGCIMQTLNVGAGRTDEEYKATEEQRRADLRSDCRDDANYFFWAAGLSALGTGLLPVRLNLLVSVGTVDLLTLYGRSGRLDHLKPRKWAFIVPVAIKLTSLLA